MGLSFAGDFSIYSFVCPVQAYQILNEKMKHLILHQKVKQLGKYPAVKSSCCKL